MPNAPTGQTKARDSAGSAGSAARLAVGTPSGLVRGEGRAPEVVAFEEALVGFFVDAADLLGVPKSVAAIYAICFASAKPLAFSEINSRLEISAGSISQGLRVLREVGALKAVTTPADKRERFEPDLELRKLIARWLDERLDKQLDSGREKLVALFASVPPDSAQQSDVLRDRLRQLQSWHGQTRAVLPLVKTFLKLT